jgi:hypothetical protein
MRNVGEDAPPGIHSRVREMGTSALRTDEWWVAGNPSAHGKNDGAQVRWGRRGRAHARRCAEKVLKPSFAGSEENPQEWVPEGEFGCPPKFECSSRAPAEAMLLARAPIFNYEGSSRGLLQLL